MRIQLFLRPVQRVGDGEVASFYPTAIRSHNTKGSECCFVVSGHEKVFWFPQHEGSTNEIPIYCVDVITEHAGMSGGSVSPANCILESGLRNTSQQFVGTWGVK